MRSFEEFICDECHTPITFEEFRYSMNHFKRCKKSGFGLCMDHQKDQRKKEYPEKLANYLNETL